MTTYEVHFQLENGHTLHVTVAAMSDVEAIAEADRLLRGSFRALGPSSVVAANWHFDEITADPVIVAPVGSGLSRFVAHPAT